MGTDKQSARRTCHRKPEPFENVGEFSDAGSHGDSPPVAGLHRSSFSRGMKVIAGWGSMPAHTTCARTKHITKQHEAVRGEADHTRATRMPLVRTVGFLRLESNGELT